MLLMVGRREILGYGIKNTHAMTKARGNCPEAKLEHILGLGALDAPV